MYIREGHQDNITTMKLTYFEFECDAFTYMVMNLSTSRLMLAATIASPKRINTKLSPT